MISETPRPHQEIELPYRPTAGVPEASLDGMQKLLHFGEPIYEKSRLDGAQSLDKSPVEAIVVERSRIRQQH